MRVSHETCHAERLPDSKSSAKITRLSLAIPWSLGCCDAIPVLPSGRGVIAAAVATKSMIKQAKKLDHRTFHQPSCSILIECPPHRVNPATKNFKTLNLSL